MKPPIPPRMRALLALAALVAGCAAPVFIAEALMPPPGQREVAMVGARGVQRYECRRETDTAAPKWVFVAPEAELFGRDGRRIGSHGAGPHWQSSDGSRVVGKVQASAPAPKAGAIPWLLLTAQSTGTPGEFSRITYIQRLNTEGGGAPASHCTPERPRDTARVPYAADYRLFTDP